VIAVSKPDAGKMIGRPGIYLVNRGLSGRPGIYPWLGRPILRKGFNL
jgi:hypothetical protein